MAEQVGASSIREPRMAHTRPVVAQRQRTRRVAARIDGERRLDVVPAASLDHDSSLAQQLEAFDDHIRRDAERSRDLGCSRA